MKLFEYTKSTALWAVISCIPMMSSATPLQVSTPQEAIPPNIVTSANKPMMMLAASKDHLLFGPIYSDFEDLDNDGIIDTTFKPNFKYYGYFDPTKCYSYADGRFNPSAMAIQTEIITAGVKTIKYSCSSGSSYWSGNFLNWATMTRLDTVRKMLYGGMRSVDTNGTTVLMGSRLVFDAHSFVKYYKGTDIRDYTPFTTAALTKSTGPNAGVYAGLSMCVTGNSEDPKASEPQMRLVKGNARFWSTVEIQLCRWRDSPDSYSQGTFGPKLARFYSDVDKGNGEVKHEISIPSRSADGATYSGIGPDLNVKVAVCVPSLLGEERCQAFPPDSSTNFKPFGLLQEFGYPKNAGDAARVEFGLITGSYDRKNTAGALRKNIRDLEDEINRSTGVFCHSTSSGCAATLPDGRQTGKGAIKAFDSIILYGRTWANYGGAAKPSESGETDLPAWGNPIGEMVVQALQYYAYNGSSPSPTNPSSSTNDTNAGMPVAAWSDPLAPSTARAKYGNGICRPLNILAFSSSALSFDGQAGPLFTALPTASGSLDSFVDKIGAAEGIHGTLRSIGSVSGKGLTAADDKNSCSAKTVGALSNVNGVCPEAPAMGGTYQVAGAALFGNTNKIRDVASPPADLNTIENALKVKTMAASLSGGAPRIDVLIPNSNPPKYVYITPESMQGGDVVSAPLTFASISSGPTYGAFIVTWNDRLMGGDYDMDITGFLRYDLIANGASPTGWDIKITTDIANVCGGNSGVHGFSVIGVNKSGVSANGRYLTHQHNGSSTAYTTLSLPSAGADHLCSSDEYRNRNITVGGVAKKYKDTVCSITGNGTTGDPFNPSKPNYCSVKNEDYLVSHQFNMVGEADALIKDPLWYAGKYGYFKSSVKNADGTFTTVSMPSTQETWDSVNADGSATPDGVPDGYFLARRPEILESQLRKALDAAAKNSNAAPAVSSAQLVAGGYKYVVKFDSTTVTGSLEAFKVDSEGEFSAFPTWEAGALLKSRTASDGGNDRAIITNSGNASSAGKPFRWGSLPSDYITQMTTASTNKLTTGNAQLALNYIRGDQSKEGLNGFRQRESGLLGPVINGTPWIQGAPSATFLGADAGYASFFSTHKNRDKLLWVAANDGMLHAFDPVSGKELFAYVPGALANRLAEIPLQRGTTAKTKVSGVDFVTGAEVQPAGTVWAYVDGNPFTADVKLGSGSWATYAFGTLGRGGKAVFALDATNVSSLTESNAASVFKWQFTSDDDSDLGYVTGDVSIHPTSNQAMPVVKMNNGKFALILGNGYKSSGGKAALFVLYMDGPSAGSWTGQYKKIVVDAGTGNGLSSVRWEDVDGNGTADVAYAGDLKGNLWKFNLAGVDPATWDVAYQVGGVKKPLYTATYVNSSGAVTPLPITTAPQVLYMAKGGMMVNFGTGSAFETGDFPRSGITQRFYGIWDRPGMGAPGGRALPTGLGTLAGRVYTRDSEGVVTLGSGTAINWAIHDGWYLDLPGTSESVLSDPSVDAGVLSFVAVRPKTTTTECTSTPNAALYTVDPISGRAERNTQGFITVDTLKIPVAAKEIGDQKVRVVNDRTKKPFTKTCKSGEPGCTCVGATCTKETPTCGPGQRAKRVTGRSADAVICSSTAPRLQWREIPGLRTDQ